MPHSPAPTEFAPYYARYIDLVPGGDVVRMLETQIPTTLAVFGAVDEARAGQPAAPGKWSLKQVVGHMADTERVFAYRAMRIARGDATPLPGFEQDDYVRTGGFEARSLRSLLDELADVRRATVRLFDGMPPEAWERAGVASGSPVSANALAYIIAGHELHHLALARTQFA
jgi:hypothetical protein